MWDEGCDSSKYKVGENYSSQLDKKNENLGLFW